MFQSYLDSTLTWTERRREEHHMFHRNEISCIDLSYSLGTNKSNHRTIFILNLLVEFLDLAHWSFYITFMDQGSERDIMSCFYAYLIAWMGRRRLEGKRWLERTGRTAFLYYIIGRTRLLTMIELLHKEWRVNVGEMGKPVPYFDQRRTKVLFFPNFLCSFTWMKYRI